MRHSKKPRRLILTTAGRPEGIRRTQMYTTAEIMNGASG